MHYARTPQHISRPTIYIPEPCLKWLRLIAADLTARPHYRRLEPFVLEKPQ